MSIEATGPNAEMITYWNEQTGEKWVALEAALDAQIEPLGLAAMERAGVEPGERVVDVGCGCGQSLLQLAERVGREGAVTGVDVSGPMLERARRRVREAGHAHVQIHHADAQTFAFAPGSSDLVFSRFGVMFFADPPAAFANLRRALASKGRVGFVCWQGLDRNPWMRIPLMAAAAHVQFPPPPPPGAPGPFAFADPERVRGILERAGFRDVALEPHAQELTVGGGGADLDRAVEFVLQMGPTGAALRQSPDADLARVRAAVREALAPYQTPRGVVMDSAAWLVTASV
jgi:SAM-dependent methyltransferase